MKGYVDIPGWFDFAGVYDAAVQWAQSGSTFVEVGCWFGKSTVYLASRIRESRKRITLYAVDTFEGSPDEEPMLAVVRQNNGSILTAFRQNLQDAGVIHLVRPIVSTSFEASRRFVDNSLSFVFIDACHTYEAVRQDILSWLPKVKSGGVLAGHDFGTYRSVARAVGEILGKIPVQENCWVYAKPRLFERDFWNRRADSKNDDDVTSEI